MKVTLSRIEERVVVLRAAKRKVGDKELKYYRITLPKEIVEKLGWKEGDNIRIFSYVLETENGKRGKFPKWILLENLRFVR